MSRQGTYRLLWVATAFAIVACGDRELSTQPVATAITASFSKTSPPGSGSVAVLKRDKAIHEKSSSAVIGPNGGSLEIPSAGLRVYFGEGAVAKPTRITATALAGDVVAYEFEPHGLKFTATVTVRQDLHHTTAESNPKFAASLQGSYFEGTLADVLDVAGTHARIKESREGKLKKGDRYLRFTIEHFSGYMVSVGLTADLPDLFGR
ncbi:MAG TPA: hypothetical protein VIV65_07815 [Gemmatimonadaceae bacterium]